MLHQKADSEEQCAHTHTHRKMCTHIALHIIMHKYTSLHNHMPYFLCNIKSPFPLLISHSLYEFAHISITQIHTHTYSHIVYTPKHSQHVNPAWKLERRSFICSNWTFSMATASWLRASYMRHVWHTDPMAETILEQWPDKKRELDFLPSLALLMSTALKTPTNLLLLSLYRCSSRSIWGVFLWRQVRIGKESSALRNLTVSETLRLGLRTHTYTHHTFI